MSFEKIKSEFEKLDVRPEEIKPCAEEEIQNIEQSLRQRLPKSYRNFLLWMGHGAGDFLRGSHWKYEHLTDIQQWSIALLKKNKFPKDLPKDAFVFFMHQGYQFLFFRLSEGDDPAIYYYNEVERKNEFEKIDGHFSDYILAEIEAVIQYRQEIEKTIKNLQNGEE